MRHTLFVSRSSAASLASLLPDGKDGKLQIKYPAVGASPAGLALRLHWNGTLVRSAEPSAQRYPGAVARQTATGIESRRFKPSQDVTRSNWLEVPRATNLVIQFLELDCLTRDKALAKAKWQGRFCPQALFIGTTLVVRRSLLLEPS